VSDNTVLPQGSGGDTIRTIDRATAKTQIVALDIGGEAGPESIVAAANALPVSGTFFQATQPVSIAASVAVTGTFFQVTQPVSGTFWQSTQPVSIAATVGVTQSTSPWVTTVSNFPATQPVSLPTGQSNSAGSIPVVLASDTGPLNVNLPVVPGRNTADQSLPVTLASDQGMLPVMITDGSDTVGTAQRPIYAQFATPPSVNIGASPLPVQVIGIASVSGAMTTSSADPSTSFDTNALRNILIEQRLQFYQLQLQTCFTSGQFIPVPEALPFLA
jgi:hypothetical protein